MKTEGRLRSSTTANAPSRLLVLGRFDLLTPGVLDFLEEASGRGLLTVGVLPDQREGECARDGVLYPQRERMEMVAALAVVDRVVACPGWPADERWLFLSEVDELVFARGGWVEREALKVLATHPLFLGRAVPLPRREGWSRGDLLKRLRDGEGDVGRRPS